MLFCNGFMMKMYLLLYYEFLIICMIAWDSVAMKLDHKFCTAWQLFLCALCRSSASSITLNLLHKLLKVNNSGYSKKKCVPGLHINFLKCIKSTLVLVLQRMSSFSSWYETVWDHSPRRQNFIMAEVVTTAISVNQCRQELFAGLRHPWSDLHIPPSRTFALHMTYCLNNQGVSYLPTIHLF